MSNHDRPSGMPKRRPVILVALLLCVVASIVYFVVAVRGNPTVAGPTAGASTPSGLVTPTPAASQQGTPSANASPSSATSATIGPSATSPPPSNRATSTIPSPSLAAPTATGAPTVIPTKTVSTTKAPLRKKEELGNGVAVQVTRVESVKGVARGPGEVAGPALRISVTVDNQTAEALAMDLALVNMYYGKDKAPAQMLSGPGAQPLVKPIAAKTKSTGLYVFGVPTKQRENVMVEFSYTTDAPTVIFTGSA